MQSKANQDLLFIYDFRGPLSWIPNCINYYYSQKLFDNDFLIDIDMQNYFFKNFVQISVFNANLNIDRDLLKRETIRNFIKNKSKFKNKKAFYLVEPFANFEHFLGLQWGAFSQTNFLDFCSKQSLHEIKTNDNFFLLINYNTEGVFSSRWFIELYNLFEKYEIPTRKVILTSSAVDIEEIHKKVRNHNPDRIKTMYIPWSIAEKSKELLNIYNESDYKYWKNIDQKNSIVSEQDLDESHLRSNKFILMNRRLRPHRFLLLTLLGTDFFNSNLVSFDMELYYRENNHYFYEHHLVKDEKLINDCFNESKKLFKIKKKTIDYDDIDSVWGFNFENKEPYLESYINICSETNFHEEGLYFSEKTWKPIGHIQPFIQVNRPNALKELKRMGFKTFHPFINEEYDDIKNDGERLIFISNEIKRINNLSSQEIHDWYYSIMDILIYNRNLLFDFTKNAESIQRGYLDKIKELCG